MPDTGTSLEFGRYKIFPARREVLADGEPLQVGDRAFDVLLRLVEAQGALDLLRGEVGLRRGGHLRGRRGQVPLDV